MNWSWTLVLLRKFAVPLFLMAYAGMKILGSLVFAPAPVPQVPPAGYEAVETRIRLAWSANGLPAPFRVQLITEDGDFGKPLVETRASHDAAMLPILEPGRNYRWRVIHEATGRSSPESHFRTSRNAVVY